VILVAALASVVAVPPPVRAFHPARAPVRLELPATWAARPVHAPTTFIAFSPRGDASVTLTVMRDAHRSFAAFAAATVTTIAASVNRDPNGTLQWARTDLPAGPTVRFLVRMRLGGGRPVYRGLIYVFLRGGRSYAFDYWSRTAAWAHSRPIFERSAASIRFVVR
jgi:hypothetical protein